MMIMGKDIPLPESPQAKFWGWILAVGIGAVSGWLFLENQFLSRAEGAEMRAEAKQIAATSQQQFVQLQMDIQYAADQNAKRQIDNQLFQLEQIPPQLLRPQDRALYQKLMRDRAELVDIWNRRGRPLR